MKRAILIVVLIAAPIYVRQLLWERAMETALTRGHNQTVDALETWLRRTNKDLEKWLKAAKEQLELPHA